MATSGRPPATVADCPRPLTRKEFFDLSVVLRAWAVELAGLDPRRVNLAQCNRFNSWLRSVRLHEPLHSGLAQMKGARPVARWQVVTLVTLVWLIVAIALLGRTERLVTVILLNGAVLSFLFAYMVPESIFGTTVEQIEGKLLRVVLVLEQNLVQNEPGFSEAVYFSTRNNLEEARRELRQQIDLAHRE